MVAAEPPWTSDDPTRDVRPRFERDAPEPARHRASGRRGPRSWRAGCPPRRRGRPGRPGRDGRAGSRGVSGGRVERSAASPEDSRGVATMTEARSPRPAPTTTDRSPPDDRRHRPRPARHRHHPDALDRRRPEGQLRASRAPRWAPRRWPTSLWTRFLRHAPTHPDWPDRDRFVLSAGHASMLLYSLLHLTGYDLSLEDLKSFRQWGSQHARPPGVRPDAGRRGDDRPARPGLRQRRRHGHRRATPGARVQPPRPRRSSTTGPTSSPPTATSRRASPPRRPAWPATCASASSSSSTTTTTSSSTGRRRWPGPRTSRSASTPTAGTPSGSPTATTSTPSRRPSRPPGPTTGPSLIAVRTHIGFGSPNKQDTPEGARLAARRDEVRLTKEAYGWDPDRTLLRAGRGARPLPRGGRRRARRSSRTGRRASTPTRDADPRPAAELPPPDRAARARPTAGTPTSRPTRPATEVATRNASQDAIQALAAAPARAVRRRRRPVRVEPDRRQGRGELQRRRARPEPAVRRPRARRWAASPTASPTTAGSSPTAPRS